MSKRKPGVILDDMNFWQRAAIGREPEGEEYLVYAIKKDLLTPEHQAMLTGLGLSIEDCLNGRYTGEQSPAVHQMYRDWNDGSERLGGTRVFAEESLFESLVDAIKENLAPHGVEQVEFEGGGGFDVHPKKVEIAGAEYDERLLRSSEASQRIDAAMRALAVKAARLGEAKGTVVMTRAVEIAFLTQGGVEDRIRQLEALGA